MDNLDNACCAGSFVQANYGAFHSALALMAAAVPATATRLVDMHAGKSMEGTILAGTTSWVVDLILHDAYVDRRCGRHWPVPPRRPSVTDPAPQVSSQWLVMTFN
jgi:hypothetical protein